MLNRNDECMLCLYKYENIGSLNISNFSCINVAKLFRMKCLFHCLLDLACVNKTFFLVYVIVIIVC
jgi:hypothetical protein